ncbi:MAG: methyltransferase domain-containing protein [Candidatus Methanoplasma sp.]|jgi:tRNA (guanine10-N2)-dimethyltransferase|nr:methyltransferase domain-containing protein [Candidatus Methanoplasma sp.]
MDPVFFFELSGESKYMPDAEARRCIEAECIRHRIIGSGPGYVTASFPKEFLGSIADRIALTHSIGLYLGSYNPSDTGNFSDVRLPAGTFAIRAKRFEGMMKDVNSQKLISDVGSIFSKNNDVDLKDPDIIVRMHMSDRVHLFIEERAIDRNVMEKRKVSERPFFSPISLHPKYARTLINLTGAKRGDTILDPFCGTGGLVIEAAEMGMKTIASDFDEEMVLGCRENMDFYGLDLCDYETIDIKDIPERFSDIDIVVTDPPYGRSTKTGGENAADIHKNAMVSIPKVLTSAGKAGVILPYEAAFPQMELENLFRQRVHGSLSRYYHIFGNHQLF